MKRLVYLLCIALMAITLAACGGNDQNSERRAAACPPPPQVRVCDLDEYAANNKIDISKLAYESKDIVYRLAARMNARALEDAADSYVNKNPACGRPIPVPNKSTKEPECPERESFAGARLEALKTAAVIHERAPNWWTLLPNCPCEEGQIPSDWIGEPAKQEYHLGAATCFRSPPVSAKELTAAGLHPELINPGQQCCFDLSGKLITHGLAAGTPDLFSPSGKMGVVAHMRVDVEIFINLGHETYTLYWPPNNGLKCSENKVP